jgi:hypothetical protein
MSSKKLGTLLADVILPLGNKLNQGNRKLTGTLGIKLASLGEIVKIKSVDNETLLQFVINGLLEKAPQVWGGGLGRGRAGALSSGAYLLHASPGPWALTCGF